MTSQHRLLTFGTYDTSLHPRVAVLRDGMAARGWTVRELNEPLGASTAAKVDAASSPSAAAALAGQQAKAWIRLMRRSGAAKASGGPDVVLVGYQGQADIQLARLLFPRATLVLDHLTGLAETVQDRELGEGAKLRLLETVDHAALAAADVVVVDTPEQAAALPVQAQAKAVVVPVGAGADWFTARGAEYRKPGDRMRVIFYGLYTPLQGAPVIGAAIAALADAPIDFTMVGHGQTLDATRQAAAGNPHVTWVDWVDSADLPALVANHDVSLGVFGTGGKTARVIPTKVYQSMAAGCAIVTGKTPAIEPLGEAVAAVPVGDAAALATALRGWAGDRAALGAAQERAAAEAKRFGPAEATAELDQRLRSRLGTARRLPPLTLNAWLRWDVIGPEIERLDPADVLEVGPGEGAAACRLAVGRDYTGAELSDRARAITEARLVDQGTPGRMIGSLADLGPAEDFDLVCAFEVIEHVEDDETALLEWASHVRPGGTLLISTPAGPERMGAADTMVGHFRRYTGEQLEALAEAAGLVDVRTVHTGYPFGYLLEAYRNTAARRILDRPAAEQANAEQTDLAAATEQSGSRWQPPGWAGEVTRAASLPGRWMQRRAPHRGTGLLLIARAPE